MLEPRFCDPFFGCGSVPYSKVGGHFFKVIAINRAPEQGSAIVVLGDTIAETIDPVGDVDEFTLTGVQGQRIEVYFQTPNGTCCFEPLVLELMDPSSDAVLGSLSSRNPTANLEDQSTGVVALPRTGDYRLRVRGGTDRYGTGAYRFRAVSVP